MATVSSILFIGLVAIANLCVGYGAALLMGRGPVRWHRGWFGWNPSEGAIGSSLARLFESKPVLPLPAPPIENTCPADPSPVESPPPTSETEQVAAAAAKETAPSVENDPSAPPNEPSGKSDSEGGGDEVARGDAVQTGERALDDVSFDDAAFEAALAESARSLQENANDHRDELVKLDQRVRDCAAEPDVDEVQKCADELADVHRRYHEKQKTIVDHMEEMKPQAAPVSEAGEELLTTAQQQVDAAEASLESLDELAISDENLDEYCKALLDQTEKQVEQCHVFEESMKQSQRRIEQTQATDTANGPRGAAGGEESARESAFKSSLDQLLHEWFDTPAENRPRMSCGVIDTDQTGQINEKHGNAAGDRILNLIETAVCSLEESGGVLGPREGQRFAVAFPSKTLQFAAESVEHVRQSVEQMKFVRNDIDHRVTVSCALLEASNSESFEELVERLAHTLAEAKRYGRNRTFVVEGDHPTPVLPPKLDVRQKTVTF